MREELWCLYILKVFQERESETPERFLRVVLSYLVGEEMELTEFRSLITKLLEKGFISQEREDIYLTPIGDSIITSLQDEISEVEREFIDDIVKEYVSLEKDKRDSFLESLKDSLKDSRFTLGKRITRIPEEELKNFITNSVILSVEKVQEKFYSTTLKCPLLKSLSKREDKFRIASKVRHQLKKGGIVENCIVIPKDEFLTVISPQPVATPSITVDNVTLEVVESKEVSSKDYIYQFLSSELIPEILKEKGFTSISNSRYIDYNNPKNEHTRIGILRIYSGFRIRIDKLSDEKYLLWIDPVFRNIFSLNDFIKYLRSSGKTDDEIRDYLKTKVKSARTLPYDSLGVISEVWVEDRDMKTEKIDGTDKSFYEFWKERHNILLEDKQPLIEIKFNDSTFKYPAQVVYIDRRVIEEEFYYVLKEIPPTALDPPERYSKTLEFVDTISGTVNKSYISFRIDAALLSMNKLVNTGYFKEVCYLSAPLLRFNKKRQKDEQVADPRAVFKFGPYSQEKEITIHSVIYPMHIPRSEIDSFIDELCSAFQRHKFGKLIFDRRSYFTISDDLKEERIKNIVGQTPKTEKNKLSIAIVILPTKLASQKFRLFFKEKFAKLREIPTQIMLEDTLNKIKQGEYGAIKNLLIQIYSKVLREGEAIWVLEKPADGREVTTYVGLGFSQKPLEGKRANSFAALCDARGLQLKWKAIGVPFEGRYITQKWFEGVLRFLEENIGEKTKRVVIFRRGDTYPSEVQIMQSSIENSGFWCNFDVNFVSVKDEIKRLYSKNEDGSVENPPSGIFIVLNDTEALCYSSLHQSLELRQGTVVPVKLKLEIGKTSPVDMMKEYYDLCYLNWSAPITISKYPFVLNIANEIAEMVKEVPDENIFRWLPL